MSKFKKKYLINGKIESTGTLTEQLDYAYTVYNSKKIKYTESHKKSALEFLARNFATSSIEQINQLMILKAENPKKIKHFVPQLEDLRLRMPVLSLIQKPTSFIRPQQEQFIDDVNVRISELNKLIASYNNEYIQPKLIILYQIYLKQKEMNEEFSPFIMQEFPAYFTQIYFQLFKALNVQLENCGITSPQSNNLEARIKSKISTEVKPDSLPKLLADIAPEKVDRLIEILSQGANYDKNDFKNLYAPNEPGYNEFQRFLSLHSIIFLGGHNSQNFQITHHHSRESMVLKVEYRFGLPRNAETWLRERSLAQVLTPIRAQREGTCINTKKNTVIKTLLITDYCQGSDLTKCADMAQHDSDLIPMALSIYSQMGTILENIVKDGCAFHDMKNSNWLLENGVLRLADTKSFVFLDKNGNVNFNISDNYWYSKLTSFFMDPPELDMYSDFFSMDYSADKMHAFMLGRNLYQFLTNKENKELANVIEGQIDFSSSIFSTQDGRQLRTLIEDLTRTDPAHRISISAALQRLRVINKSDALRSVKEECDILIEGIKRYKQGHNDVEIEKQILGKKLQLIAAKDLLAVERIRDELIAIKMAMIQSIAIFKKKTACHHILAQIKTYQVGENDWQIQVFIENKELEINETNTDTALEQIYGELEHLLIKMKADPALKEIRDIVKKYHREHQFYTVGMQAKVSRIETAMAKIPIHQRSNAAFFKKSNSGQQVLKELASHRYPFRSNPITDNGDIDEDKAAYSYRLFQAKINLELDQELNLSNKIQSIRG